MKSFEVEVLCAQCNATLKVDIESWQTYLNIHVEPCKECFDAERERIYKDVEEEK